MLNSFGKVLCHVLNITHNPYFYRTSSSKKSIQCFKKNYPSTNNCSRYDFQYSVSNVCVFINFWKQAHKQGWQVYINFHICFKQMSFLKKGEVIISKTLLQKLNPKGKPKGPSNQSNKIFSKRQLWFQSKSIYRKKYC